MKINKKLCQQEKYVSIASKTKIETCNTFCYRFLMLLR